MNWVTRSLVILTTRYTACIVKMYGVYKACSTAMGRVQLRPDSARRNRMSETFGPELRLKAQALWVPRGSGIYCNEAGIREWRARACRSGSCFSACCQWWTSVPTTRSLPGAQSLAARCASAIESSNPPRAMAGASYMNADVGWEAGARRVVDLRICGQGDWGARAGERAPFRNSTSTTLKLSCDEKVA